MAHPHTDTEIVINASTTMSIISHQLSSRFPKPQECLTAHLLWECSEVLGGVKPANLVSLVNRTRPCGRNLHHLWQSHREEMASRLTGICLKVLQTSDNAVLLFCYNPDALECHLAHAGIRALLKKAGYDATLSSKGLLTELCSRIETTESFPHEIGLFIGYPAKDVAAFMGMVKLPFTCQGPWKIYGNPVQSLGLAGQHRRCRQRMAAVLATGDRTALELHNPKHPFFCQAIDRDFQYLRRADS